MRGQPSGASGGTGTVVMEVRNGFGLVEKERIRDLPNVFLMVFGWLFSCFVGVLLVFVVFVGPPKSI